MSSTSKEPAAKEKDSTAKELFQWLIAILAAVAIALFVDNFLIVNAQIPSGSMENTIMTGDRVVGNRLSYLTKDPERYDVIIFKYPDDESQLFIKRIIGLPNRRHAGPERSDARRPAAGPAARTAAGISARPARPTLPADARNPQAAPRSPDRNWRKRSSGRWATYRSPPIRPHRSSPER